MHAVWNNFKTALLMSSLMGLCLAVGYLIGGQDALLPALLLGGTMNFIAFVLSDKIALATVRATPLSPEDDPELWSIVRDLTERAGLPMPRLYISPAAAPNAFATGRSPQHSAVCVTAGLRKMLSREELGGVIAHELSHIKNRDVLISTVAAVIAGAISWLAYLATFPGRSRDERRGHPLIALLRFLLAPLAASLIQLAISRSREFEADRSGARIAGSPRGLANALQRLEAANRRIPLPVPDAQANMFIVAPLTGSSIARLFMTHPPAAERVRRLLAMDTQRD
ncbi:MAG: zinc metalloprotease HtpX [Kiritimatiellia bacterium]